MSKSTIHKRLTYEDKFDRKFWVSNRAKRNWIRFTKHTNNKKLRRIYRREDTTFLRHNDDVNE